MITFHWGIESMQVEHCKNMYCTSNKRSIQLTLEIQRAWLRHFKLCQEAYFGLFSFYLIQLRVRFLIISRHSYIDQKSSAFLITIFFSYLFKIIFLCTSRPLPTWLPSGAHTPLSFCNCMYKMQSFNLIFSLGLSQKEEHLVTTSCWHMHVYMFVLVLFCFSAW